jgi:hypothetical protein
MTSKQFITRREMYGVSLVFLFLCFFIAKDCLSCFPILLFGGETFMLGAEFSVWEVPELI